MKLLTPSHQCSLNERILKSFDEGHCWGIIHRALVQRAARAFQAATLQQDCHRQQGDQFHLPGHKRRFSAASWHTQCMPPGRLLKAGRTSLLLVQHRPDESDKSHDSGYASGDLIVGCDSGLSHEPATKGEDVTHDS